MRLSVILDMLTAADSGNSFLSGQTTLSDAAYHMRHCLYGCPWNYSFRILIFTPIGDNGYITCNELIGFKIICCFRYDI